MDFFKKIEYCPPNVTIHDIWVNHGLSHCFFDTVSTAVIAAFIVVFGTIQMIIYRKYATRIEDLSQITASKLYYLQILLLALVPSLSVLRFVLEGFIFADAHLYGYTVMIRFIWVDLHLFWVKKLLEIRFNLQFLSSLSADCCIIIDLHFIPVFDMFGAERTLLSIAINTNSGTWSRIVDILVDGFYQWKFFGYEFGKGRLVASCIRYATW